MKHLFILGLVVLTLVSCNTEAPIKTWQHTETIVLEGVNPIGLVATKDGFWFSDGDHNRMVHTDEKGTVITTLDSFQRPMHLDVFGEKLFIPEYGNDVITTIERDEKASIVLKDSLDAPAGISVFNKEMAIADFYNHRVLYSNNGEDYISIGSEGKHEGEFYYPTDVQITSNKIYVADAYNHRVQVFDKEGSYLQMIGVENDMNAATGIYVSDTELYVTDFENDRVLVFDLDGNLKQELSEDIEKPTDMVVKNDYLHIVNYRSGELVTYQLKDQVKK